MIKDDSWYYHSNLTLEKPSANGGNYGCNDNFYFKEFTRNKERENYLVISFWYQAIIAIKFSKLKVIQNEYGKHYVCVLGSDLKNNSFNTNEVKIESKFTKLNIIENNLKEVIEV